VRRETYDLEKERRVALRENGRAGRAGILSLFMIELVAVVAGVSVCVLFGAVKVSGMCRFVLFGISL